MSAQPVSSPTIPLAVKLAYSLWMLFWVLVVLANQGPQNFFWLCNMAMFVILYALWREHRLLLSSQAGVVVLVGLIWSADVLTGLVIGRSPTGFTAYMFSDELPLIARLISFYHLFLPVFLLWMLWRLGYDRRGPVLQSFIGIIGIVGAWLFTEAERNVNWIHRPFEIEQTWMPEPLWVLVLILACPLVLYFPGHWLVRGILAGLNRCRPGAGHG